MADMDTYDGDQRGYEGNYRVDTSGENYGHSEILLHSIKYHYALCLSLAKPLS